MNSTTKALLRHTILEAINSEQDAAAMELLALLTGSAPSAEPVLPALPAVRKVIEGPARDYHYWASFIRDTFLPHITNNGRLRFTSNEMFSWLENNQDVQWTAGDVEFRSDGSEIWRGTVSNALTALKDRGFLQAKPRGRDYVIAQLLPTRHHVNGLLNAGPELCGLTMCNAEPT
jgi:hypothetical protein